MIGYRNRAAFLAAAPLILLFAGMPRAEAQSQGSVGSGPIKLFQFDAPAAPVGDAAAGAAGSRSLAPTSPQGQRSADIAPSRVMLPERTTAPRSDVEGIEIRKLDNDGSAATGPLTPTQGGLGIDLWAGTTADRVADLINSLPSDIQSPALRELARRMLLSSAEPPSLLPLQASAEPQTPTASADDLLRLRAERLYAMGEFEGLNALLELFSERRDDQTLRRLRVDGLLLAGDWEAACRPALNALARAPQESYWQRVKIACDAVAGDDTRAHLGLDLLRESGADEDGFADLINALLGVGVPTAEPPFSALNLATMAKLGVAPSPAFRAAAPSGWNGVFAGLGALPLEERVPIAERAVGSGALAAKKLAALYVQPIFDPIDVDDPIAAVARGDLAPWQSHALLYQAAKRQTLPLLRAQLLTAYVDQMASEGAVLAGLRTARAEADAITPSPGLSWAAPTLARTYYLSGDAAQAEAWRLNQQETARLVTPLWPYLQIFTGGRADPAMLNVWAQGLPPSIQGQQAVLVESIVNAFHDPSLGLQAEGPRREIQQAALAGRPGETLLLILREFGARDLASLDVPALALSVAALHQVGYTQQARMLAAEALAASGV